ncbi:hypothetical protein PS6_006039 [Mucor atramentarius]
MKLRNRKKRVLGNVKQEEQKADIALISTSSFTVNEPITCDVHIKQEDTKNDNSSLKQNGKKNLEKEKTITTNVIYASRECQLSSQ